MKAIILAIMLVLGLGTAFVGASIVAQAQSAPASGQ